MTLFCAICLILSIFTSAINWLMDNTAGAYYYLGLAILLTLAIRTFRGDRDD